MSSVPADCRSRSATARAAAASSALSCGAPLCTNPDAGRTRPRTSELQAPQRRRGMEGRALSRVYCANAMQPLWRTHLVPLPGGRLRTAGSNPLCRRHLRLPALLSARLRQRARGCGRPGSKTLGQAPGAPRLETWHTQRRGRKPKWMRWRTFERLAAKHDALVGRSMLAMMLKLGGFRDFPE